MRINILGTILLTGTLILSSGCKKWLDVNDNPNIATDVPLGLLLSSAEVTTGSALGVDLQINGSMWAQYWTQGTASNQYNNFDQYQPNATSYDRVWSLFYANALKDLDRMEEKARETNQADYRAV